MCDATFTFGQRGGHFFQCPSRREVARLPRRLSTLLSSPQLQHVYHVTLGFEDSFLITWRDTKGNDHIDSAGLPTELTNFLYARNSQRQLTRNIPQIRCTLGPYNASFFAHDTAAYLWMEIPPGLLTALESRIKNGAWTDPPRIVALGAANTFLLITAQHAAVWDLGPYRTLSSMLEFSRTQERGLKETHNITLHPYRYGAFIAQSKNGTLLHENAPPHTLTAIRNMSEPIAKDTKKAERAAERAARQIPEGHFLDRHVLDRHAFERRESESSSREGSRGSTSSRESAPLPRRTSNLQQRAQVRREWNEHRQQFSAQGKGLKLSLSLSISAGGLARMLG